MFNTRITVQLINVRSPSSSSRRRRSREAAEESMPSIQWRAVANSMRNWFTENVHICTCTYAYFHCVGSMNAARNMQMVLPCSVWWRFSWLSCRSELYLMSPLSTVKVTCLSGLEVVEKYRRMVKSGHFQSKWAKINMQMTLPHVVWWIVNCLACTSVLYTYLVSALKQGQGHLAPWTRSSRETSLSG